MEQVNSNSYVNLALGDAVTRIAIFENGNQLTSFVGPAFPAHSEIAQKFLARCVGEAIAIPTFYNPDKIANYIITDVEQIFDENLSLFRTLKYHEDIPRTSIRGENKVTNELNLAITSSNNYYSFSSLYDKYLEALNKVKQAKEAILKAEIQSRPKTLRDGSLGDPLGKTSITKTDYDSEGRAIFDVLCPRCMKREFAISFPQATAFLDSHNHR